MLKNIAVFGATTYLGLPVTKALVDAGFNVYVLSNDVDSDKALLPDSVVVEEGNWMYHHDLKRFLRKVEAIYCSLSVDLHEKDEDFHAETDGLREILNAGLECGIKRIAYLSSILQYNTVESDDMWWVFRVKKDAVNYVRDSGIPYTIFYPSTFMENFLTTYRKGKRVLVYGQSNFPVYLISNEDYARMVALSFKQLGTQDVEYFIQGRDCYKLQDAAKLFVKYSQEKLKIKNISMTWLKIRSYFGTKYKFIYELAMAMNENNEQFISEDTQEELGLPNITFSEFAKKH